MFVLMLFGCLYYNVFIELLWVFHTGRTERNQNIKPEYSRVLTTKIGAFLSDHIIKLVYKRGRTLQRLWHKIVTKQM